jgi:hypothetical protein
MQFLLVLSILTGWASQYSPGIMQEVINNRQAWEQIPEDLSAYDGFVAVLDCAKIGDEVMLKPEHSSTWEKFLVVDCAGEDAVDWMQSNNILVEVDYSTAKRWNTVGNGIRVEYMQFLEHEHGLFK